VKAFTRIGLNFEKRVLPCGHYTTGETPYKYIDGCTWAHSFTAFKALREEKAAGGARLPSIQLRRIWKKNGYALTSSCFLVFLRG